MSPFTLQWRFDGAQMGARPGKVNRNLRARAIFESLPPRSPNPLGVFPERALTTPINPEEAVSGLFPEQPSPLNSWEISTASDECGRWGIATLIEIEIQNETHQTQVRLKFLAVPRIGEGIRLQGPDGEWASYDVLDLWYQRAEYGDVWVPYIHVRLTPPEDDFGAVLRPDFSQLPAAMEAE